MARNVTSHDVDLWVHLEFSCHAYDELNLYRPYHLGNSKVFGALFREQRCSDHHQHDHHAARSVLNLVTWPHGPTLALWSSVICGVSIHV